MSAISLIIVGFLLVFTIGYLGLLHVIFFLFLFLMGVVCIILGVVILYSHDGESPTLPTESLNEIDFMDGYKFEKYVGNLYRNLGYEVQYTPLSGDQGADLIISRDNDKIAVQTKCYRSKVSNKAIQEVVSSKALYDCNRCSVVTNNYFTDSAIQLGNVNNVELIDRDNIIKIINEVQNQSNPSLENQIKSDSESRNKLTFENKTNQFTNTDELCPDCGFQNNTSTTTSIKEHEYSSQKPYFSENWYYGIIICTILNIFSFTLIPMNVIEFIPSTIRVLAVIVGGFGLPLSLYYDIQYVKNNSLKWDPKTAVWVIGGFLGLINIVVSLVYIIKRREIRS
ncbi:restriction endonuclease [Methanohalophilus sp. RSK]|uniref:restriction endonuclease n=1 Tax=Methanohalophilus sp. RSK TaxID=2485783 RepID=UPI001F3C546A|nr:restriction endonuclease [Methanohalophilus sp. RSK]